MPPPRAIILRSTSISLTPVEEVVRKLKATWPLVDIVVWAPRCSADLVLAVLKAGAKDVVLTDMPSELSKTTLEIIRAQKLLPRITQKQSPLKPAETTFGQLVSLSPKMWDLFELCKQVAKTEVTVLLQGETGTGKELMARGIHRLSQLEGRFVAVNCAGIPEQLIDSELFGHIKGAFTGAGHTKKGLFSHASKGTLFLDEIGNMPVNAQHHLLRVLQEGTFRVVGDHLETVADARIIAAASQDLELLSETNKFREDLFYRLDVFRITIPSLRERPEDIVYLFNHFAKRIAKRYDLPKPEMTSQFIDALLDYSWPGNVRQLENHTERLLLTHSGQELKSHHFKKLLRTKKTVSAKRPTSAVLGPSGPVIDFSKPLDDAVSPIFHNAEITYLTHHLRENRGKISQTAEATGINRRTLLRKMKKYNLLKTSFSKKH